MLSPVGANPLSNFDVLGTTQRIPTPAHGFCVQMVEGSPPTRIMIPKKGAPTLNLLHRYLTPVAALIRSNLLMGLALWNLRLILRRRTNLWGVKRRINQSATTLQ